MVPAGWRVTVVNSPWGQLVSFTPRSDFNDFGNSADPSSDTVRYTPREAESLLRLRRFPHLRWDGWFRAVPAPARLWLLEQGGRCGLKAASGSYVSCG